MSDNNLVRVGVGLYILDSQNRVLMGLRKSKHGEHTWCPPGGHLEFRESFEQAGAREAKEETDLNVNIEDIQVVDVTNDIYTETNKHYITIHLVTRKYTGQAKINEPDKWEKWDWFDLDNLPQPLMLSVDNFLCKNNCKNKLLNLKD